MFGKRSNGKWKAEYDDMFYKIYDSGGNLAAYLFPEYGRMDSKDKEDEEGGGREEEEEIISELNKNHAEVTEGTLLLPMVKLNLLDNSKGLAIDYIISSLEGNIERTRRWKIWLRDNAKSYNIVGSAVHTAREDRNMLSIALGIVTTFRLGEKEVREFLSPLLNKLHEDGLL